MAKLEVWGNRTTMNLENILYTNIQNNLYFRDLARLANWTDVVDEIYSEVDSVAPWAQSATRVPSTAFCLLYKLFTLKPTTKQIHAMLSHRDSPFIRAIGFLYLRYCTPPHYLFQWFEKYLWDEEEFSIRPNSKTTTIGQFARDLLTSNKFVDTQLPRIPIPSQKDIERQLQEWDAQNKEPEEEEKKGKGKEEKNKNRSRSRSRDRERERRRSKERDGDRDRDRDRDRGRNRRSRSRSRDRDRRNRSRSRDRERDRRRDRSRSRDRDRYRRNRSRERDRRDRSRSRSKERTKRSRSPSPLLDSKKAKTETESTTPTTASKGSLDQIISMYIKPDLSKSSQAALPAMASGEETIRLGFRKS